jgi:hypothetical protein
MPFSVIPVPDLVRDKLRLGIWKNTIRTASGFPGHPPSVAKQLRRTGSEALAVSSSILRLIFLTCEGRFLILRSSIRNIIPTPPFQFVISNLHQGVIYGIQALDLETTGKI